MSEMLAKVFQNGEWREGLFFVRESGAWVGKQIALRQDGTWFDPEPPSCVQAFQPPPPKVHPTPGPGGRYRYAATNAEYDTAIAAAVPGDVIVLTTMLPAKIQARSPEFGGTTNGGVPGNHIKICGVEGAGITTPWASITDDQEILVDVQGAPHIDVCNLTLNNGFQGVRYVATKSTPESRSKISHVNLSNQGSAQIYIGSRWNDKTRWSESVEVIACRGTGMPSNSPNVEHTEFIYVGSPRPAYVDRTKDVHVRHCYSGGRNSEGVEFKNGVTNVTVEYCFFEDRAMVGTGPIAVIAVMPHEENPPDARPADITSGNYVIRYNRIRGWGEKRAITLGIGGGSVYGNLIWDPPAGANDSMRLRNTYNLGNEPITIANNTFFGPGWTNPAYGLSDFSRGDPVPVSSYGNLYNGAGFGEHIYSGADFVGPTTGQADSGLGPGSGFFLDSGSGLSGSGTNDTMVEACEAPPHYGAMPARLL